MPKMRRRGSFGNVHRDATVPTRQRTIVAILDRASHGVATFNEVDKDHAFLIKAGHARGFSVIIDGELAIAYSDDLEKVGHWSVPISPGGYVGADGVATKKKGDDDRRVGPARKILLAVFYDPKAKKAFFRFTSHDVPKAGTTAKWRQALLFKGWAKSGAFIQQIVDDVPDGSGDGDKNWNKRVDYPGTPDTSVWAPATFGNRIYDQINRWGAMKFIGVDDQNTASDHDMLYWINELDGEDVARPVIDFTTKPGAPPHVITPPKTPAHRLPKPKPYPWRRKWDPSRLRKQANRTRSAVKRRALLNLANKIAAWRRQNPRRR